MARILTCVEGVGDGGICPSGTVPELVEGYIFSADPTVFDASTAAEYFAYSFGFILLCFAIGRCFGVMLGMIRRG